MEPVNGLERLTELLRKKVTEKSSSLKTSKAAQNTVVKKSSRLSVAALEQHMQQRIKSLQQADANHSTLQHIIVESILTWEFGEQMRNEPKFASLVNRVEQHIEEEPEIKTAMEKIYKRLLRN